jgi:hypothetical protein
VLRNFLKGLQIELRGEKADMPASHSPYGKWMRPEH